MIYGETFLSACTTITIGILCLSLLLTAYRAVRGPTLPDRVLALDMLVAIAIGFIAVLGIRTASSYHVDIAIALALVGFLATAAFARFVMTRGPKATDPDPDWELRRIAEADGP